MEAADSSTMTIDEPKRKRAKHSKTRKGCARCKQRHIKCDETKPACTRCTQANLTCPGYEEVTSRVRRGPVRRFRIIQGPQTLAIAPAKRQDSISSHDDPAYIRSTSTPLREQSAIDFFTSQTLPSLAKYSPGSDLWTTTAFTRLIADAKIRNIVVAVGLAHQDLRHNFKRGHGPSTVLSGRSTNDSVSSETLDCDRYYNAALAYMRVDISYVKSNSSADKLEVAVACLLFVFYLSLQDRMEEAAVHMHSGLDIISEGGESFLTASPVHRETYLYFLFIATQSWPIHPSASLYHLIMSTAKLSCYLVDLTPLQALRFDFDSFAHQIFQYTSIVTRGFVGDPQDLINMKRALLEEAESLADKIEAFDDDSSDEEDSESEGEADSDTMFVQLLRARLLIYRLFSQSVGTRYQTTYDRYMQDFDDATTLIGQAIQIGQNIMGPDWPLFSINLNILGILGQAIFLCRHPVIRRRALNLMNYCPQREGILEAAEMRQLSHIQVEFEENGLDLDPNAKYVTSIPEENRLHFLECIRRIQSQALDVGEDEILVRLMYRPDGDSGYIERRVKVKRNTYNNVMQFIDA